MKVLFVGVFTENSTNIGQLRELRKVFKHVDSFDYRNFASAVGYERMFFKFEDLANNNYDLLILSKCNRVPVSVLEPFRNSRCKIFLWYMDPMGNFDNELKQKIYISDYVGCALYEPWSNSSKYNLRSYFIPEGFDQEVFKPLKEKVPPTDDVTFIGSLYGHRKKYVNSDERILVLNNAYSDQHNIAVASSKINLNFTDGGTSDRAYKVLATKGFMLTQPWPNMHSMFPDKCFDTFTSIPEMKEKITYYLDHPEERIEIAARGYIAVQPYTYKNWAESIKEIVTNESLHYS